MVSRPTKNCLRVNDEPIGPLAIDEIGELLDGAGELDLARMEDGVLLVRGERGLFGDELCDREKRGVPAMGASGAFELGAGLRECDVKGFLATGDAGEDELHGDGGFAGAWIAFEKVHLPRRQAAEKNLIEAGDPCVEARGGLWQGGVEHVHHREQGYTQWT